MKQGKEANSLKSAHDFCERHQGQVLYLSQTRATYVERFLWGALNVRKQYSGWNIVFVALKKQKVLQIIFEAFKTFISKTNKLKLPKKKKVALGAECLNSSCRLHDTIRKVLLQMFHYETKTKPQPSVGSYGVWIFSQAEIVTGMK